MAGSSPMTLVPKRVGVFVESVGSYATFVGKAFSSVGQRGSFLPTLIHQMVRIGVDSLPVVMLASAFAGIVATIQTAYQLQFVILSEDTVGMVVGPTIMLELAALIPGLVLASRVGASIAAEIGTMKVTEQIDALEAMGMNSVSFLVLPRVTAAVVMFPPIYVASALVGFVAGGISGEILGYLTFETFIRGAQAYIVPFDAMYGAIKMLSFGFLITSIACWKGFITSGGADGVGKSTTGAVVTSCVSILIADYLVAELLL
ncbi:MAG: ABC transporter permease [Rhodothermia bacterium]|nr:MAG: ABC transporter permease [Rhodothermia bacterium]